METSNPSPGPQGLVSEDEGGLWMRTDSDPVTDHTADPAPASITRYYSVMDEEGADDIFIPPPPPSYIAPVLPAEGSTDAMGNNPRVTLTNWASDATEAKANPSGLDWHHGQKQLMAAHSKVDEVKAGSEESVDTGSLSKDKDSTEPKDQDRTTMERADSLVETCYEPRRRQHPDNTTGDEEPNVEPEDVEDVFLSGGQENCEEHPKQVPTSIQEHFENGANLDKTTSVEALVGMDSKLMTEHVVITNSPTLTSLGVENDESFLTTQSPNQPQIPEVPADVSHDDEENVDTRSLDYSLTKYDWVQRESVTSEAQAAHFPTSKETEEAEANLKQGDESRRTADIQQGEQLLQRLQQLQLRQDVRESPNNPQDTSDEMRGENKSELWTEVEDPKAREDNLTSGDNREERRTHIVHYEEGKINLMEDESGDVETKARMLSPPLSGEPEHPMIARTEAGDSDDDPNGNLVPSDLSPINAHEASSTQISFASICQRFSATDTSTERQIHGAAEAKQNLQRASGPFNLVDNPDVLEIPFKTNISLDPLPATVALPCQRSDWQFSQQKMEKEISQEIQRELVLVNQGKIPGGYSKGEVRQLKETKLLFEAFQQDNSGGPTRHRKTTTSLIKSHVYPNVLERTHSLEMFSLKSRPVSRAHSLMLHKSTSEMEKSSEGLRSKSPIGSRNKKGLFPNPKQDKNLCLCRSMDSISTNMSVMDRSRDGKNIQGSPLLKQNPFYKLRPALALQPDVEKDIREAKEREEELRRQRCTLYGEKVWNKGDGEKSEFSPTLEPDVRQSRGKLERVWPPPSKQDQMKEEQTQQEAKVHRAAGQKALWQRWESGLVNGQLSEEKN